MEKWSGKLKFTSFENFILKTEQKESPRTMPYLGIFAPSWEGEDEANTLLKNSLEKMLNEAKLPQTILPTAHYRDFLKTTWMRDSFLNFNGIYYSWRWIDATGSNRPEREWYVLHNQKTKEYPLPPVTTAKRFFEHPGEEVFAVGEGGLYFPDHDNKTLFISESVLVEFGKRSLAEREEKIYELHEKIFGEDISMLVLPKPDETHHLDTHISVIPETKMMLVENKYYKKLEQTDNLSKIYELGYTAVQTPSTKAQNPLNILYLDTAKHERHAFTHMPLNYEVRRMLRNYDIEPHSMPEEIGMDLDIKGGGMRCITNELHTKDSLFLKKLGFNLEDA